MSASQDAPPIALSDHHRLMRPTAPEARTICLKNPVRFANVNADALSQRGGDRPSQAVLHMLRLLKQALADGSSVLNLDGLRHRLPKVVKLYERLYADVCIEERPLVGLWLNTESAARRIAARWQSRLKALQPGERALCAGGWASRVGGHFILFSFMRERDSFALTVYNSGAGIYAHNAVIDADGRKTRHNDLCYTGIARTALLPERGVSRTLRALVEPLVQSYRHDEIEFDSGHLYGHLLQALSGAPEASGAAVTDQRSGSCTWRPLLKPLREFFPDAEYGRLKHHLQWHTLVSFWQQVARLPPPKQAFHSPLLAHSRDNVRRDAAKLAAAGAILPEEMERVRASLAPLQDLPGPKAWRPKHLSFNRVAARPARPWVFRLPPVPRQTLLKRSSKLYYSSFTMPGSGKPENVLQALHDILAHDKKHPLHAQKLDWALERVSYWLPTGSQAAAFYDRLSQIAARRLCEYLQETARRHSSPDAWLLNHLGLAADAALRRGFPDKTVYRFPWCENVLRQHAETRAYLSDTDCVHARGAQQQAQTLDGVAIEPRLEGLWSTLSDGELQLFRTLLTHPVVRLTAEATRRSLIFWGSKHVTNSGALLCMHGLERVLAMGPIAYVIT